LPLGRGVGHLEGCGIFKLSTARDNDNKGANDMHEQALIIFISNLMNRKDTDTIKRTAVLLEKYLPSGSGFDNGTTLNVDKSTSQKLVFEAAFHHMNEHGHYTRWTDHTVTVRPAFQGLDIRVSGRNHNDIKEYIGDCFDHCLEETVCNTLRESHLEIARGNMA